MSQQPFLGSQIQIRIDEAQIEPRPLGLDNRWVGFVHDRDYRRFRPARKCGFGEHSGEGVAPGLAVLYQHRKVLARPTGNTSVPAVRAADHSNEALAATLLGHL